MEPSDDRRPFGPPLPKGMRKDGWPHRILVCDDERHIVRLLQVNLEHQGYEVIVAFGGREALVRIAEDLPDFVILDAEMPGMDGYQVLDEIRRNPDTANLPVIMLAKPVRLRDLFK